MTEPTAASLYADWREGKTELYEEIVPTIFAGILHDGAWDEGAPNFMWHLAETGLTPEALRVFARRWEREEFSPVEFAGVLDRFADDLQALTGVRHEAFR